MAVSATVFEILTLKAEKSLNFSDRPLFEASVRGEPLEFGDEIWRQKVLGLPDDDEIMPLAFFVLTQYRRVTDRRTDTLRSLLPALAERRAGKNCFSGSLGQFAGPSCCESCIVLDSSALVTGDMS